jgi:hypothetical protein
MSWRDKPACEWTDQETGDFADFTWPMVYYKIHGIPIGQQEVVLRDLAARYARFFTTADLADDLWEVMQASPQRHGYGKDGPWTLRHAADIARRAGRFIDREDAAEDARWREADARWGISAWLRSTARWAQSQPSPASARMSRRMAMREATRGR